MLLLVLDSGSDKEDASSKTKCYYKKHEDINENISVGVTQHIYYSWKKSVIERFYRGKDYSWHMLKLELINVGTHKTNIVRNIIIKILHMKQQHKNRISIHLLQLSN